MLDAFKAVKTTAFGIKCDTLSCDWADWTVASRDYKSWVDVPCPKCSASLMTPANYKSFVIMQGVIMSINIIAFPILVVRRLLGYKEKHTHVHVDSKPDGSVKFNEQTMH